MKRRSLLGALLAAPLASFAQTHSRKFRLAILQASGRAANANFIAALKQELKAAGYVEGGNLEIMQATAEGDYDRLPGLAKELVARNPDVILASTTPVVRIVRQTTDRIPIVMVSVGDPVGSGFAASLARPGGNITGTSNVTGETSKKQLELLVATFPKLSTFSVLENPANPAHAGFIKSLEAAAKSMGVRVWPVAARSTDELTRAISSMQRDGTGALIVLGDPLFFNECARVAELATTARLPSICAQREHAQAGSLMSYGADLTEGYRRAASYIDKILKGAKPAELAVEQTSKLQLVINLKTAKALGVTIPQGVLVRADEVIQ